MGRRLVPAAIVAAMLAFTAAALTAAAVPGRPAWWDGVVALAVLGGITPMIYAITIRIVPVFARRTWPSEAWLRIQMVLAIAGAWVVFFGRVSDSVNLDRIGHLLALAGGLTFTVNIRRLFRQPPGPQPAPPLPFPEQQTVDRLATRLTMLSGGYLVIGLSIGVLTSWWRPETGRWDLVWAHAMLVGFFLTMAAGVCYHTLSRWTGRRWIAIAPIRLHVLAVTLGLPIMLLALAIDRSGLFLVAGPVQAGALALFLANVAPMVPDLPAPTRVALFAAGGCLLGGIGLGAGFAIDPALGARLRLAHAELNLFGWTGLVISGVGAYLVPRLLGRPLMWPRLLWAQLAALATGALLGALALGLRAYGHDVSGLIASAQVLVASGFLLFGTIVAATAARRTGPGTTARVNFPTSTHPRPQQPARAG